MLRELQSSGNVLSPQDTGLPVASETVWVGEFYRPSLWLKKLVSIA
jgi:hypothetical protein